MKKTITALALLFFSVNSFALDINKVSVQLPQFNFQNNKGSGVLQKLSLETDWGVDQSYVAPTAATSTKFDISREGKAVKFGMAAVNVTMKNANDLLTKLHSANVQKLNVELAAGNVHQFGVGLVDLSHESTGDIHAEGLTMTCQHKKGTGVSFSMIVDECLVKSTAHADMFEVPDMDSFFIESFIGVPIQPESDVLQTLKEMELEITKGDFDMSLKIKGIPLVKLKADGNIKADMNNKRATIRIDKVKLGFVGVTDIVMKQLKKKLPPENFRVEPPYIYATW
ncbi:hypothetical protein [Pseudobdellovibrio sp. HCB154]|uniref:hypothetical protein n=1 Tax=Pseudobdellovibrio sp. HCB154 TaxID=3386277 RepID=UPI0039171F74